MNLPLRLQLAYETKVQTIFLFGQICGEALIIALDTPPKKGKIFLTVLRKYNVIFHRWLLSYKEKFLGGLILRLGRCIDWWNFRSWYRKIFEKMEAERVILQSRFPKRASYRVILSTEPYIFAVAILWAQGCTLPLLFYLL